MKSKIQFIIRTAIYFTPAGFFLNGIGLISGEKSAGVMVRFGAENGKVTASYSRNPRSTEKFSWIFHGAVLIIQAFIVSYHQLGWGIGHIFYSPYALFIGLINILTALNPKLDWNHKHNGAFGMIFIISLLINLGMYEAKEGLEQIGFYLQRN